MESNDAELLLEMKKMEENSMKVQPTSFSVLRNSIISSGAWPSMKPIVNGFLTGQVNHLPSCVMYLCAKGYVAAQGPHFAATQKGMLNTIRKNVTMGFLFQATFTTAQLGIFETLTKKVAAANGGRSTTLYQEAGCGFISGAIASSIFYPFVPYMIGLPSEHKWDSRLIHHLRTQPIEHKWDYRNLYHGLCSSIRKDGFLALWKGSAPFTACMASLNMGMLTSYGRSLKYFEESIGVGPKAQLGAGIVSAFSGVTCGFTCGLLLLLKDVFREHGKKYPLTCFAGLAFQILKPGGGFDFYSRMYTAFNVYAPFCALQWIILEKIRKIEESNGF